VCAIFNKHKYYAHTYIHIYAFLHTHTHAHMHQDIDLLAQYTHTHTRIPVSVKNRFPRFIFATVEAWELGALGCVCVNVRVLCVCVCECEYVNVCVCVMSENIYDWIGEYTHSRTLYIYQTTQSTLAHTHTLHFIHYTCTLAHTHTHTHTHSISPDGLAPLALLNLLRVNMKLLAMAILWPLLALDGRVGGLCVGVCVCVN
jgi:hypothetical protein